MVMTSSPAEDAFNPALESATSAVQPHLRATCLLALDVGQKRIGLATHEPGTQLIFGLETLVITQVKEALDTLKQLCARYDVTELLVGLPLSLSGEAGAQAQRVQQFAEQLAQVTGLPVTYLDERLSSVQATRSLQASGVKTSRHKGLIDQEAARILLETELRRRALAVDETR